MEERPLSRPPIRIEVIGMDERKEYKVLITETLQKKVLVKAANEQEAHRRAQDAWSNAEYILDADDFQGVEFHVMGEADDDDLGKDTFRVDPKDVYTAEEAENNG